MPGFATPPTHSPIGPGKVERRRLWPVAVQILGTGVLVGLLVRFVPVDEVLAHLHRASIGLVVAGVALAMMTRFVFAADRWRRIMRAMDMHLGVPGALFVWLGSYAVREVLPFKSGDLAKVLYLQLWGGHRADRVASTLVYDRANNLLAILLLMLLGSVAAREQVPLALIPVSLLAGLGMVLLLVSQRVRELVLLPFGRVGGRVARIAEGLLSTWQELPAGKKVGLLLYATCAQVLRVSVLWCMLRAVGVLVPTSALFFLGALSMLVTNAPVSVAGVGTREGSVTLLFASFGDRSSLLAAAVLYTLAELIVPVAASLPFAPIFLGRCARRKPT